MSSASAKAPSRRAAPRDEIVRVQVWDLVVRCTHWAIFLSIAVLAVTGAYIGHPFIVVPGEARFAFVMGTMRTVHFAAGLVFGLAVVSRVLWMFVGTKYASWRQFVPASRKRRANLWRTFLFYTMIRRDPPPAVGHNALAGATYVLVFLLYFVMILTGIGMYTIDHPESWLRPFGSLLPLFGGVTTARWIHHVVMWLLIGFFVHHLASAILMSVSEKNGTIGSIFSGDKWMKRRDVEEDEA